MNLGLFQTALKLFQNTTELEMNQFRIIQYYKRGVLDSRFLLDTGYMEVIFNHTKNV